MMSMFRYCEKGWKWLFLTMIALSVVACGDDTDDFWMLLPMEKLK